MSTPLNNLPLKTQNSNDENNDINDPMVQDVLNEFQEELIMSQKPNTHQQQSMPAPMPTTPPPMPPPQHHQHYIHNIPPPPIPPPPMHPMYNKKEENKQFPYNLVNIDILQKVLIIVIVTILIYSSNILPLVYDKLPSYLSDFMEVYDFFIKSFVIFIAIYVLFIFEFI